MSVWGECFNRGWAEVSNRVQLSLDIQYRLLSVLVGSGAIHTRHDLRGSRPEVHQTGARERFWERGGSSLPWFSLEAEGPVLRGLTKTETEECRDSQ